MEKCEHIGSILRFTDKYRKVRYKVCTKCWFRLVHYDKKLIQWIRMASGRDVQELIKCGWEKYVQ